jgi:SAM-dependent methyltransferase
MESTTTPPDSSVYYQGRYWNDLEVVRSELNRRATGSADQRWYEHFRSVPGPAERNALILNCGNGWVERDLLAYEAIDRAHGTDISHELLEEARHLAEGLPITYSLADINQDYDGFGHTVVVNHAAGHHIARIDKVMRAVAEALPEDGLFVSWDYVGPHRNQYSKRAWAEVHRVNALLPPQYRAQLFYPHLRTMIAIDPTEAIHSELFRETVGRYFDVFYERILGGAIAYPILTSEKLHEDADRGDPDALAAIALVLEQDLKYTDQFPKESLFSYFVARPQQELPSAKDLERWGVEEAHREDLAQKNHGFYYGTGEKLSFRIAGRDYSLAPWINGGRIRSSASRFVWMIKRLLVRIQRRFL